MKAAYGIYGTFAVLVVGGGWFYLSRLDKQNQIAAHAAAAVQPETLPPIALSKADAEKITKIELTSPDDDDKTRLQTITLEKLGPDWEMTSPLHTRASASKVADLTGNLGHLHPWMAIDGGTSLYEQDDLTEEKALHVVAWKGRQKAIEFYCGKSSPQGQLARVPGKDGIFALVSWGADAYAGFLYTRSVRSWRETSILAFDEGDVVQIEITNQNGVFSFSRSEGRWIGSLARRQSSGKLGEPERTWQRFDQSRVEALLQAYRSLDADDFGEPDDVAASGVDRAESTGGVVRIKRAGQAADLVVRVGKLTNSTTRWAIKDSRWAIRDGGDGTLYALSPWTAGWATADARKFEKDRDPGARRSALKLIEGFQPSAHATVGSTVQ